jgi:cytochrome b6-f complex iron-sulfur subunit
MPETSGPENFFDTSTEEIPEDSLSRRTVVTAGLGLVGAAYFAGILYPVYRYLAAPAERALAAAAVTEVELPEAGKLPAGSALMFKFGIKPALLIHHSDDTWVAFSAVCTHLGCTVQFLKEKQQIYCACHGGTYDMKTGKNIGGPPPKPLSPFNVEVTDGKVVVKRA